MSLDTSPGGIISSAVLMTGCVFYILNIYGTFWMCLEGVLSFLMCPECVKSLCLSNILNIAKAFSECLFVKLRSRSSSGPGPFLVHSRSILSHSNLFQFKIRWSGPGADATFTVSPPPPTNFCFALNEFKPILYHFLPSQNGIRWHLGPNSCQDDPLSSQTPASDFVHRGHLDGEITFWGNKCLTKVVWTMITGILNIPTPVRKTLWTGVILKGNPVLPDSNSTLCGWGSSWRGKWHFVETSA